MQAKRRPATNIHRAPMLMIFHAFPIEKGKLIPASPASFRSLQRGRVREGELAVVKRSSNVRFKIAPQKFVKMQHAVFGWRLIRADFFNTLLIQGATALMHARADAVILLCC